MDSTIAGKMDSRSKQTNNLQFLPNTDRLQQVEDNVRGCTWQLKLVICCVVDILYQLLLVVRTNLVDDF